MEESFAKPPRPCKRERESNKEGRAPQRKYKLNTKRGKNRSGSLNSHEQEEPLTPIENNKTESNLECREEEILIPMMDSSPTYTPNNQLLGESLAVEETLETGEGTVVEDNIYSHNNIYTHTDNSQYLWPIPPPTWWNAPLASRTSTNELDTSPKKVALYNKYKEVLKATGEFMTVPWWSEDLKNTKYSPGKHLCLNY